MCFLKFKYAVVFFSAFKNKFFEAGTAGELYKPNMELKDIFYNKQDFVETVH